MIIPKQEAIDAFYLNTEGRVSRNEAVAQATLDAIQEEIQNNADNLIDEQRPLEIIYDILDTLVELMRDKNLSGRQRDG